MPEEGENNQENEQDGAAGEQQAAGNQAQQLPDDHPLVRTLAANKVEIKDLKAKAKRLDDLEESQKSETQKMTDRVTKAEAEAATVPAKVADALKSHLIALHEIDKEDAELFLGADEPELLLKQVNRLLGQSPRQRRKSNYVAREGENPSAADRSEAAYARELFGG